MSPAIYQSARSPEAQPSPPRLHVSFSPFASSAAAGLSFYGLMGRGFRAPSVHENFGRGDTGVICSQGRRGFACYKWVSNPVLEAEISESREAGIRYNFNGLFSTTDQLRLQLGYVNNDSTDFIDQADLDLGEIVINGRRTHMDQRLSSTSTMRALIAGSTLSTMQAAAGSLR